MKLTALLLFSISLSALGFSQGISITAKRIPLEKVFVSIEKQSDYFFLYNYADVQKTEVSELTVRNADLEEALRQVFKNQDLTYSIKDKTIIVTRKNAKQERPPLSIPVTGKVTDDRGEPLAGATVKIKGTTASTVTNGNGEFEFRNVKQGDILVVSYLGFSSREIVVSDEQMITVVLQLDAQNLSQVVVVGYGTQKKVNLTGSVSTISSEDLAMRPVGQTSSALQGLAPGVTVTQASGQPGGDAGTIRIRGVGTLGDSNPLILIDGVEGALNNVDPNIIESISVLKDAASSSIYGSRAANGVVLVTTKRAKNAGLSVNYDAYAGWQTPTNLPKMVNAIDHMLLTNEAYANVGQTPLYSEDLISKYRTEGASNRDLYPETDWQKEVLTGSGMQQSHFLSLNGGSDKIKFLTSVGYLDQAGIIETSGFKRFSIRNNADVVFSDKLNARLDVQFINATTMEPGRGSGQVFHWMNRIPANQAGINTDGTWGEGWNGDNPIAFSRDGGKNRNIRRTGTLNFSLNYQPVKWLKAELTLAPVLSESAVKQFNKVVQTYKPDGTVSNFLSPAISSLTESSNKSLQNNIRATLTLDRSFGDHNFKLLSGLSREDFRNDFVSAYRDRFILPDYPVLVAGAAVNQQATGNAAEWALQSLFGRLNYNFKEKYLMEFNARYDGSSRFSKGNKYGFFPSLSLGWRVSQEDFMKGISGTLTDLKIRGSWGQLGNQNIGNYPFASSIQFGSSTLGKQIINTAALNDAANLNISWETTEMINLGLDATLFSKLSITADYYDRETRDILYLLDIPLIMGLNAPSQNVGVVSNKGWELGINYNGSIRDLKYSVNFNLSDVQNKVISLNGINRTGLTVSREGYPINSIYGLETEGYFADDNDVANHASQFGIVAPGDLKYKDQNGDGIINDLDNVVIGSTIPRLTFGTNLGLSYKGFSLNALIQGVGKADGYLFGHGIMPFYAGGTLQEQHKKRWTPDSPDAAFPRLAFGYANNEKNSSFWMKDASYLRLKNIQLGYTVPTHLIQRTGIKNLRLYVNGQNLFTLDNFWDGYDVETPVSTGGIYPQVKLYTFGVNANF